jgi:5-methylcytosine-specific restriction endonuclease McrA
MNTMVPRILHVDAGGAPVDWMTLRSAVVQYVQGKVLWEIGDRAFIMRGGRNQHGVQSEIHVASIIATVGQHRRSFGTTPALTNSALFARDRHVCLYCGDRFPVSLLSRDHVVPQSWGGPDTWDNTVTACKACNSRKGARTPDQAGIPLIALPYAPNEAEALILANRNILVDQNDYLARMVPDRGERWQ